MRGAFAFSALFVSACHSGTPFEFQEVGGAAGTVGCNGECEQTGEVAASTDVEEMTLGVGFSCARFAGGAVKCWGKNQYGVLGSPAHSMIAMPAQVGVLDFGTERRIIQITAGWWHACALFEDHRARCWGRNDRGQLGLGNTDDYGDDPEELLSGLEDLPLEDIVQISAGVRNTCALVSSRGDIPGKVHCWGSDTGGALGDESSGDFGDDEIIDATRPVALPTTVVAIATGGELGCALLSTGKVHCWGDNWARTLGIGDSTCDVGDELPCFGEQGRSPDIPVVGLGQRTLAKLSLNQTSACVLDNDGQLFCWGRNSQSRLGYPEKIVGEFLGAPPGAVELGDDVSLVDVAVGLRHACALDSAGRIRCWGEAGPALGYGMAMSEGATGIGGTQTPAEAYRVCCNGGIVDIGDFDAVDGIDRAVAVYAGSDSSCALLEDGSVRCWGANAQGELGYGSPTQIGALGDESSPGDEYLRLKQPHVVLFAAE